jgi:hypothetical protein
VLKYSGKAFCWLFDMVTKNKTKNRKKLFSAVVLLLVLAVALFLVQRHYRKPKSAPATTTRSSAANQPSQNTPSPAPTKANPGGVVDKNGQVSGSVPPASQWTTSTSGNITLQQPAAGSIVQTGDTISGLAKVSTVQFILTDNSVGLIDQGTLNVVNGKFAGTLAFAVQSDGGKLEVYSPNPTTGAEEDIININVNFSN